MIKRYVPHTSEWFDAVSQDDPESAVHTAQLISDRGGDDICGACGGRPAADYEAPDTELSDGSATTMRFCAECVVIRRLNGENWLGLI